MSLFQTMRYDKDLPSIRLFVKYVNNKTFLKRIRHKIKMPFIILVLIPFVFLDIARYRIKIKKIEQRSQALSILRIRKKLY